MFPVRATSSLFLREARVFCSCASGAHLFVSKLFSGSRRALILKNLRIALFLWGLFAPCFAETPGSVENLTATSANLIQPFFYRLLHSGPVTSLVLFILVMMSISTWGVVLAKWLTLKKVENQSQLFIKSFWDSRSLNDLNSRLGEYPYSPMREVFRNGYAELVRSSQLKDQCSNLSVAINAAIDNLSRTLQKSKQTEKKTLERYLTLLAVSASSAPFIGLFGTVWGIMTSFEGIATSGNTNLASVAPGISEALIATAFGLAAAIPAVIGYNFAAARIRGISLSMDGFGVDFLNIVERYLVADKKSGPSAGGFESEQTPRL